jgi:hypothetical protein
VWLFDKAGRAQDFFCADGADPRAMLVPQPVLSADWQTNSVSLPDLSGSSQTLQRRGRQNNHAWTDWAAASGSMGTTNKSLALPFRDAVAPPVEPSQIAAFTNGQWQGEVRLLQAQSPIALVAECRAGPQFHSIRRGFPRHGVVIDRQPWSRCSRGSQIRRTRARRNGDVDDPLANPSLQRFGFNKSACSHHHRLRHPDATRRESRKQHRDPDA